VSSDDMNNSDDVMSDSTSSFPQWKISVELVDTIVFEQLKRGNAAGYDNLTPYHINCRITKTCGCRCLKCESFQNLREDT